MKKILFACALAPLLLTACGDDEEVLPKVDSGEVAYTQCPDENHPHAIDLGLPSGTKWACCNIGAKKATDDGQHFAWGDPQVKTRFSWPTYAHYNVVNHVPVVDNIGEDIQGGKYDIARNQWQYSWSMPTTEQILELKNNCDIQWTTREGIKGIQAKGKNGAAIFLPAAGYKESAGADDKMFDYHRDAGNLGYYWTSNSAKENDNATSMKISSNMYRIELLDSRRCKGYSVRAVRN